MALSWLVVLSADVETRDMTEEQGPHAAVTDDDHVGTVVDEKIGQLGDDAVLRCARRLPAIGREVGLAEEPAGESFVAIVRHEAG